MQICSLVQTPQAQWYMSVIPAYGKLKRKDYEFGINLDYTVKVSLQQRKMGERERAEQRVEGEEKEAERLSEHSIDTGVLVSSGLWLHRPHPATWEAGEAGKKPTRGIHPADLSVQPSGQQLG